MEHTKEYKEAISCPHWYILRRKKILASGDFKSGQFGHCEKCGGFELAKNLQLHHKHYRTLKHETMEDVELLCSKCHKPADELRIATTIYDNGLNTWATKKYGEDWYLRPDVDQIEEEYEKFLERQEEKKQNEED